VQLHRSQVVAFQGTEQANFLFLDLIILSYTFALLVMIWGNSYNSNSHKLCTIAGFATDKGVYFSLSLTLFIYNCFTRSIAF